MIQLQVTISDGVEVIDGFGGRGFLMLASKITILQSCGSTFLNSGLPVATSGMVPLLSGWSHETVGVSLRLSLEPTPLCITKIL